jgi:16S rRNA (cytosine967-C5)-methyltransferase
VTARGLAIRALVDIERSGRANIVVPNLLDGDGASLPQRDRAFVTELVYGTVRMQRACDWLIGRHLDRRRPLVELDPPVRAALRLGAYQLAFLHTPPHAAVSETVAFVRGPARGLVNAVLRRVAEDVAAGAAAGGVEWPDTATRLSYPDWIVDRLSADLGADVALAALEQMNQPARMTTRADGYIQDLASQQVAAAVAAGMGASEVIADLCAAPGGKATYLASARPAVVVAADIDPDRARVIVDNSSRLGLSNVATVVADAVVPPLRPRSLDRVLVDAPCSGLGVLRRRPDARWRIQPSDVDRLALLQRRLVDAALPLLSPGGLLVYCVCTLTRAETVGIDEWMAEAHPSACAVALDLGPAWEQGVGRGARVLPQVAGTDGMFVIAVRAPAGR